MPEPIKMPIGG